MQYTIYYTIINTYINRICKLMYLCIHRLYIKANDFITRFILISEYIFQLLDELKLECCN